MYRIYFKVDVDKPEPDEQGLRAAMPHVPRVGEVVVFPFYNDAWPHYRVEKVEHLVNGYRNAKSRPPRPDQLEQLGIKPDQEYHMDDLWPLDEEAIEMQQIWVTVSRSDHNAPPPDSH